MRSNENAELIKSVIHYSYRDYYILIETCSNEKFGKENEIIYVIKNSNKRTIITSEVFNDSQTALNEAIKWIERVFYEK